MPDLRRRVLLNPGPATTTDSVKYSQVVSDICPREKEFGEVMQRVRQGLVSIATPSQGYTCVLFGGSGTAAMDSVISSAIGPEGRLLIINNGNYGERFAQIARTYGINHLNMKFPLDRALDLDKIDETLDKEQDITHLALVHHETTTGILNPLKEIGEIAHKQGVVYIADTISSFAGVPFDAADCKLDFLMSTSNKCVQAMPGVSFVICRRKKLDEIGGFPARNYYLDLHAQHMSLEKTGQTRFTPPVQTMYSLEQAIKEFFEETAEGRYRRYSENWRTLIDGLKPLGFTPLLPEELQSRISTTFIEPKNLGMSLEQLHDALYERGFTIYPNRVGDQKTIRFANMGDIDSEDIRSFLQNLREVLSRRK